MKETVLRELGGRKPAMAKGHFCIDLTDPLTGRVKERRESDNHVFKESLFSGGEFDWIASTSKVWLCLQDSDRPIDPQIPYLMGQTIGYGIPGQGSKGVRRGAFNAANQVLAQQSTESVRWKFQYDFTAPQCNGESITTVGLTHQHDKYTGKKDLRGFKGNFTGIDCYLSDGRRNLSINGGIVRLVDVVNGLITQVDKSLLVGSVSYQSVGFAPSTGRYYIYTWDTSAPKRFLYEFSDRSFATLLQSYPISNNLDFLNGGFGVHGTTAYFGDMNLITKLDFGANSAGETIPINSYNYASYEEETSAKDGDFAIYPCCMGDRYLYCAYYNGNNHYKGILFDLAAGELAGYVVAPYGIFSAAGTYLHPLTSEQIVCNGYDFNHAAIAAYQLGAPITKTAANGMTVTYELEVFW